MAEHVHRTTGRTYAFAYLGLLVLTGATFFFAVHPVGLPEMPVALTIAVAKAVVVALFFMHLIEQRFVNRMVVVVSMFFVALLVTLTVTDVATRRTFPKAPSPLLVEGDGRVGAGGPSEAHPH